MDRFWACGKNNESIQEISSDFFKSVNSKNQHRIMLSGYVTDSEGMKPCIELFQGDLQSCLDLDLMIKEAIFTCYSSYQKDCDERCTSSYCPFE